MKDWPITTLNSLRIQDAEKTSKNTAGLGSFKLGNMTTSQRLKINNTGDSKAPIANGTMVYDTDDKSIYVFENSTWVKGGGGGNVGYVKNGDVNPVKGAIAVYNDDTGLVISTEDDGTGGNTAVKLSNKIIQSPLLGEDGQNLTAANVIALEGIGQLDFGGTNSGEKGFVTLLDDIAIQFRGSPSNTAIQTIMTGGGITESPLSVAGEAILELQSRNFLENTATDDYVGATALLLSGDTANNIAKMVLPISGMIMYDNDAKNLTAYVGGDRNYNPGNGPIVKDGTWAQLMTITQGLEPNTVYAAATITTDENGIINEITSSGAIGTGLIRGNNGIALTGDGSSQNPYLVGIQQPISNTGATEYVYPSSVIVNDYGQITEIVAGDAPVITSVPSSPHLNSIVTWGADGHTLTQSINNTIDELGTLTTNTGFSIRRGGFSTFISSADSLTEDILFKLPHDNGTFGYVLQTDGTGTTSWVFNGGGTGNGDVVGPSLVANDQIAVFDGVTGKLLKDGGKTIAQLESGRIAPNILVNNLIVSNAVGGGKDGGLALTTTNDNIMLTIGLPSRFTTASNNLGLGALVLDNTTTGKNNTAIGNGALKNANTSSSYNVALGLTTGPLNSIIVTTGCTFIGTGAKTASTLNLLNAASIGYNSQVDISNSMVLGSNVNVGIGTSSPVYPLHISNNVPNQTPCIAIETTLNILDTTGLDSNGGAIIYTDGKSMKYLYKAPTSEVISGRLHHIINDEDFPLDANIGGATLNGLEGTVINTTSVTTDSIINVTRNVGTDGLPNVMTIGNLIVGSIVNGVSFMVYSTVADDVGNVNWSIINP